MKILEGGSFFSVCVLLAKSIVGAGVLTLSDMMRSVGWVPGVLLLCGTGLFTLHSLLILHECASKQKDSAPSFYSVMDGQFPGWGFLPEAFIFLKCFGVSIGFLIQTRNILQDLLAMSSLLEGFKAQLLCVIGPTILIMPAVYLRKIDALKFTSTLGMAAAFYLVLVVGYDLFCHRNSFPTLQKFDLTWGHFLEAVPPAVFSFGCQQNLFSIYNEARDKRFRPFFSATALSVFFSLFIYLFVGLGGYICYGAETSKVLFDNFPNTWPFVLAKIFYALLLLFSYPLQVFPMRASVLKFCSVQYPQLSKRAAWNIVTAVLVTSTVALACFLKDITIVQKFVGTFATPILGFILPAALNLQQRRYEGRLGFGAVPLLLFGVLAMVFSFLSFLPHSGINKIDHP